MHLVKSIGSNKTSKEQKNTLYKNKKNIKHNIRKKSIQMPDRQTHYNYLKPEKKFEYPLNHHIKKLLCSAIAIWG